MKPYLFNKRVKTKIWVTIQVDSKMKISRRGKIFIDHLTLVAKKTQRVYHTVTTPVSYQFIFTASIELKSPLESRILFNRKVSIKKHNRWQVRNFFERKFDFFSIYIQIDGESSDVIILILWYMQLERAVGKKREVGNF